MKLNQAETSSALWIKLRDHMQEQLDELRRKNDGDLDPIQTARLRGRVLSLKNLLEMEKPDLD